MEQLNSREGWKTDNIQVFWGEIAAHDHTVQFYESDKILLDTLEGFAGTGLLAGESVLVIASADRLEQLNARLAAQHLNIPALIASNHYLPLDAQACLQRFMRNQWPDEQLFYDFVAETLSRAKSEERKVRAYGEMVKVLWQMGLEGATVQLEKLWCKVQSKNRFSLYCAYPRSGFTQNPGESMQQICLAHSRLIDGSARPATEIYHR